MADAAAPANFHDVQSPEHFQNLLSEDLSRVSLINFWAPWAAPCKQMNEVVLELAKKYPQVLVLQVRPASLPHCAPPHSRFSPPSSQVEAETQADIAESFEVEAVPTFVILRVRHAILFPFHPEIQYWHAVTLTPRTFFEQGHTLLGRISGADAPALTKAIAEHARAPSAISPQSHTDRPPAAPSDGGAPPHESEEELNARLRALMDKERVMLFMKGNPDAPRCGFSRRIVALLRDQGVEFGSFDILTDESVRAGLKVLNNWPTFPQLVVKGEFVGGLDVVTEMVEKGELKELLES